LSAPRVDIGIPTRNWGLKGRRSYLTETIDSVLAQTFTDWRLTISENGLGRSLDDLVGRYLEDARVRYVATGKQLSGAGNSTALLRSAKAPYVALLHDDDRWDPDFLARRVSFLDEHPGCGFVFGGHRLIDEDGRVFWRSEPTLTPGVHAPREYLPLLIRHHRKPQPPTALVRLDAYRSVGDAFDERFPGWDYEMWIRLAARFPCGFVAARDADYRIYADQTGRSERWGTRWIELDDHIQAVVAREGLGELFSPSERRRQRATALLRSAIDEAEGGESRDAAHHAAEAARLWPAAVVTGRFAAVVATIAGGSRARRVLAAARRRIRRLRAGRSLARLPTSRIRPARRIAPRLGEGPDVALRRAEEPGPDPPRPTRRDPRRRLPLA
jgi:glycosyltransferase involved in cell wall biosynthesis